jgi:Phosphodiester glycosidase
VHRSVTGSGPGTNWPDRDPGQPGRRPARGIPWRLRRWASRRGDPGRRRLRDRLWVRITAAALTAFLLVVGWSVGHALTVPGGGSISERLSEWARDHWLGPLVTFGEWLSYSPPKAGGKPSFALTGPSAPTDRPSPVPGRPRPSVTPPPPLKTFAGKPLPGEGRWRVLATVHGVPAIYGTYLRASRVYSSYVAGIASMNQSLLRFQLRPGTEDPGPGAWKAQPYITPGTRRGLEATFNSGFKISSSGGGFYLNGVTNGALTKGEASEVYYRNGHIAIGVWGHGLHMSPDVVGVRQNLRPIVSGGKVPGSVDNNVTTQWGATLGGGYYVWRSGIGVTKDGHILFVYGPALNVRELAEMLKRAGAVTAMELDINPDWMSYMSYRPGGHPNNPTPRNLLPDQMQPANRYYSPSGRDFTVVYAR